MKIIAVNEASDIVPFLIYICKNFKIDEKTHTLTIFLANSPYRTDGTAKDDVLVIHPDNWDWVDEWPLNEEGVEELKTFRRK